jgi:myo-inositol-1(or 4)-monophosphatase
MTGPEDPALDADWLGLCRRAAAAASTVLARYPLAGDRTATAGVGVGGDLSLVIDREVEDAVFDELDASGLALTVVSEERGEVLLHGGGPVHVVVDPIDGSRNAKRGLPAFALSIGVASGPTMADVRFGYVHDFGPGEDWWASHGVGAWLDGEPLHELSQDGELEMVGLETVHPEKVLHHAEALAATGAARLRAVGSIAISLCYVAAGRLDGLASLGATRSVDSAAGQLIVREAGGAVAFPDTADGELGAGLDLDMRSRVVAATSPGLLDRLLPVGSIDS